jgi:hypothetical protein
MSRYKFYHRPEQLYANNRYKIRMNLHSLYCTEFSQMHMNKHSLKRFIDSPVSMQRCVNLYGTCTARSHDSLYVSKTYKKRISTCETCFRIKKRLKHAKQSSETLIHDTNKNNRYTNIEKQFFVVHLSYTIL